MDAAAVLRLAGVVATLALGTLMLIQGGFNGQLPSLAAAGLAAPTALAIWFRADSGHRGGLSRLG
jgi:hypothetical protein